MEAPTDITQHTLNQYQPTGTQKQVHYATFGQFSPFNFCTYVERDITLLSWGATSGGQSDRQPGDIHQNRHQQREMLSAAQN